MRANDYSKQCSTIEEATEYVGNTNSPAHITIDSKELTIISKDSFNKLTANLDEDDVWYLGFLGASEQHVAKGKVLHKK